MKRWKSSLGRLLVMVACGIVLASPMRAEELVAADGWAPVIFTAMTHTDSETYPRRQFHDEKSRLNWGMNHYTPFGVRMNLEASAAFATADTPYGAAFLYDVVMRPGKHGVGTHCNDVRAFDNIDPMPLIKANKDAVDVALGGESVRNVSVSGICSRNNWVKAAADAGFQITDAAVGLCYLSMPARARPAGWTDTLIQYRYYHDPAPVDSVERFSPIRLENALDFAGDPVGGVLTLSNGELGELASLAEGRGSCGTSCSLTEADFEVVYAAIERVAAFKGAREVGRINIHVPSRLFDDANEDLFTSFLNRLKTYADAGKIVFGTQLDVLETYEKWR